MAELPYREKIMSNVEQACRGIRQDAGYHFTVREVTRQLTGPYTTGNLPSISVYEGDEYGAIEDYYTYTRFLNVAVEMWIKEQQKGKLASELNKMLADVEKAVLEDHTRGGEAMDTQLAEVTPPILAEGGESEAGLVCFFIVQYRFSKQDPARMS